MYENTFNVLLKKKLIDIIKKADNIEEQILEILYNELEKPKLTPNDLVRFCICGYPISYTRKGDTALLELVLKQEVDFDHFKEYYYCPNCNRELKETQY